MLNPSCFAATDTASAIANCMDDRKRMIKNEKSFRICLCYLFRKSFIEFIEDDIFLS